MTSLLNVTNGDCAVGVMKQAGISGEFLPWRDFLYEGPVLRPFNLTETSKVRANFIAQWSTDESMDADSVYQKFLDRDNALNRASHFDKIVLWFEHDLYDQLQLLQILAILPTAWIESQKVHLICTDVYFGELTPEKLLSLKVLEKPVTKSQKALAEKAWAAYCNDSPVDWQALVKQNTQLLPYLNNAIIRSLQQYPHYLHGLCRVGVESLKILAKQELNLWQLFSEYQKTEAERFLTDMSFQTILVPLIKGGYIIQTEEKLNLSETGHAVLKQKASILDSLTIDRWVGGVHLTNDHLWMWHQDKARLIEVAEIPEN